MEPASFTVALDPVDAPVAPTDRRLRGAHARVWIVVTARWRKHLPPAQRHALGTFTLDGDAAQLRVTWSPVDGADPRPHLLALTFALEAAAIAKQLAPLGLRPRDLRVGLDALEPAHALCGVCRAAWGDPTRWLALPPAAVDALATVTAPAFRAAPDATRATLDALLADADPAVAFAAAHAFVRLLRQLRARERASLAALVAKAWRHPDPRVARTAWACAPRFKSPVPAAVLDAWAPSIARALDDGDALAALTELVPAASRSTALVDATPTLLRMRSAAGRERLRRHLQALFGDTGARWKPAQSRAFEAFAAGALARPEVEYVAPLLRHLDRLTAAQQTSLVAWLDAADVAALAPVAWDLFGQQPTHPALTPASLRLLLHPSDDLAGHGVTLSRAISRDAAGYEAVVDLLRAASSRAEGTPAAPGLRLCLDQMLCDHLDVARPARAGLAAALLAAGTPDAHIAGTAERLVGHWLQGLRDEKLAVVRAFVDRGHADALVRAFDGHAKTHATLREGGPARVAHLGQGLSWSMQRAGAWAEGGAVARRAAEVAPVELQANLRYNEACGCAQTGDAEGAARALATAIALDGKQADDARADEDFAPVRTHPAIVALLG
ncbi:MAG: hypothetical protein U0324_27820 [Polyangiales bacterium]